MTKPSTWLRYLPAQLRVLIEHRPNLQKVLANTSWLFVDKIVRMGLGLVVGVWVARYLGPEQFGLLNYATAFVALFGAISTLGLNSIVVRDLVREPETANVTLGTAFLLQMLGGFLAFGLAVFAISFAREDDSLAKLMVAVLSFTLVFKASDVVKYWFESQVRSKYVVWVENGAFLVFAVVKITLILSKLSLMAFIWAAFSEGVLVMIGLLSIFAWNGGRLSAWRGKLQRVKTLLKDSWPLILSGLAVMTYMRIDQIMLGQMLGDRAVGIYAAAVRISEIWYFIPVAIVASVFPSIIDAKKQSVLFYDQRIQKLYDLMVLLAFIVGIPMSFASSFAVVFLFGDEFVEAGPVLAIHIWAGIFVFLGIASSKWLIIEGFQKFILYRTLLGALVNVLANFLLIPVIGVTGAAIATVLSYFIAVFSVWLRKETRIAAVMMSKSLILHKSLIRMSHV